MNEPRITSDDLIPLFRRIARADIRHVVEALGPRAESRIPLPAPLSLRALRRLNRYGELLAHRNE